MQKVSCWVFVATWMLVFATTPATAQSMRLELTIAHGSAEAGSIAKVPIRFNSAVNIGALQLELVFDPALLRFKGIENGPVLSSALVESNVVQPGRARVALVSNEEVKGSGVLLVAEFEMLAGPPVATTISLESARGWDQINNLPVLVVQQPGEWMRTASAAPVATMPVSVPEENALKPAIPVWLYGLGGLVVLIIAILLLRRVKSSG